MLPRGSILCFGLPRVIRTPDEVAVLHAERNATERLSKNGLIKEGHPNGQRHASATEGSLDAFVEHLLRVGLHCAFGGEVFDLDFVSIVENDFVIHSSHGVVPSYLKNAT